MSICIKIDREKKGFYHGKHGRYFGRFVAIWNFSPLHIVYIVWIFVFFLYLLYRFNVNPNIIPLRLARQKTTGGGKKLRLSRV